MYLSRGPHYAGIKIYNNLPTQIKLLSGNFNQFEKDYKYFLQLHSFYTLALNLYVLYSINVWNLYEYLKCYILSLWCFIVLLNHEYDNFYLFYLEWYAWWQILYPMVALLEVDYSNSQWMNE